MKTMKGPAIFLAQFAGDAAPFNSLAGDRQLGRRRSATRASRSRPGTRGCSTSRRRRARRPTATRSPASAARRASRSPSSRRTCRASSWPCIPPMTPASTASRRRRCTAIRRRGSDWAVEQVLARRQGLAAISASTASVTFSGALAWPYLYPWPQRPPGLIEAAFDELAQALEADPRRLRRCRRRRRLRAASGRGRVSTARPSRCSSTRVGGHQRCSINYDPSHFVLQQLDYLDFIDIYHERINAFHVKDAEFNPTGRQGVYSGYPELGRTAPAASARSATGRSISAASSPSSPSTTTTAGRCSNGSARSSIPSRAPPRARRSSRATSSASPSTRSTTSPAARRTSRPTSKALGLS